jgi:predicted phosphate transport protein (TIGR00153 family)
MGIQTYFRKLVPKEKRFFPLYEEAAETTLKASLLLKKIFLAQSAEEREPLFQEIKDLETHGDHIAHRIFDELDKSFITPFDREDVHKLAFTIDDVLDYINGSSQRIKLFKPKSFPKEFVQFADLLIEGVTEFNHAILELKNLKKPEKITQACIRINELENAADDLYHVFLTELFENEKDAIELIKKREIIMTMERAADRLEDVSDVLKTIIIKVA